MPTALRARERVDARGRVVLPGFSDAHAHSVWFGMTLMETDLSGVGSLDDVYQIIGDRARDGGADEWIVAAGFNPVLLHGAVPKQTQISHSAWRRADIAATRLPRLTAAKLN